MNLHMVIHIQQEVSYVRFIKICQRTRNGENALAVFVPVMLVQTEFGSGVREGICAPL
jgi:hypothetical protein